MFQERTLLDLLVEYNLDKFDENPLEVHRQADGEIQLMDTGDNLIDKWEQQLADGDEVDLWESFSPEARARIEKMRKKAPSARSMREVYLEQESIANKLQTGSRDFFRTTKGE